MVWTSLRTTNIQHVTWDQEGIHHLVLPAKHKESIMRTANSYQSAFPRSSTRNIPARPLVMHFYGYSGTGKTFAAHALAESLKAPLLVVDLNHIRTENEETWVNYKNFIIGAGQRWHSIMLLDQADELITPDLEPELGRVSAATVRRRLLILLESYPGIIILTTRPPTYHVYVNPGIRGHISLRIPFDSGFPDPAERLKRTA
jgi:hypothetical protein